MIQVHNIIKKENNNNNDNVKYASENLENTETIAWKCIKPSKTSNY